MSPKTATNAIGVGFAVAAMAALAQLGLAYGFGLLSWAEAAPGSADPVLDHRWNANLAWVVWFAAASCVVGGLASGVIGGRGEVSGSPAVRVAAVAASAVGAFAVGPLVALSAQQSAVSDSFPPDPLMAAAVGSAVGFVLTLIGLGSRSVAVNVGASIGLIWLLAILATFVEIGESTSEVTELAVWGSWGDPDSALGQRGLSIAVPFVVGSALIGAIVAILARRKQITSSGYRIAAASGIAGPLIVTVAHLVAGPPLADSPESMAVFLVGPYAAIAGLLGSLVVTAIPRAGSQVDDDLPGKPAERDDALVESAPGWTVPQAPGSAFDDTNDGKTKSMPGRPAEAEAADPDVDWVQELKPVGEGGTLTADKDTGTDPKPAPKPKRTRKASKRTRRKLGDAEPDAASDSADSSDSSDSES
ncbi:hypothetical protein [Glycomyces tarimensis]